MMVAPVDLEPVQQAILTALRDHPAGLTRPELADECEQDDLVVSRALAAMRGEELSRTGLRGGFPIYVLGKGHDVPLPLPAPAAPTTRLGRPSTTTPGGIPKRVLDVLEKFGPMTMGSINKHVDCYYLSVTLSQLKKKGLVFHIDGHQRGDYRWGLAKHVVKS